jgi:ABC-type transport system substrate-binding protein
MATRILTALLVLTLISAVACGSAAPEPTAVPDPPATQAADAGPVAEPSAAPVESATSQPTAKSQMAAPSPDVEVNPGKLTIMVGDLGTERFDQAVAGGAGGTGPIYGRIMGGYLISDNETRDLVPGIAEDWNLSGDGLTWEFTIRDGVKFHDGSNLTPEDVLWTLQNYFGPQAIDYSTSATVLLVSRVIDRIELGEANSVNLITESPITPLAVELSEAGTAWFHIMPKRDEVHNEEVELAYDNNPIGSGVMKLVGRTPAQVMEFERFDDYYYQLGNGFPEDKRVKFQSLDIFVVPEEATRVSAIRSGEADMGALRVSYGSSLLAISLALGSL